MAFIINKYVTGRNFIGRRGESNILSNLLCQGENVTVYEPAKTGKQSLIQQTFYNMKVTSSNFIVAEISFHNVRTLADACTLIASEIIKSYGIFSGEFEYTIAKFLPGTHFVYDPQVYASRGRVISLSQELGEEDIKAIVRLPYLMGVARNLRVFVYISEFQNIMLTEDGDKFCRLMNEVFKSRTLTDRRAAAYLLVGSQINAMKDIIEKKHYFLRQIERVKIAEIEFKDLVDYATKSFLSTGKVVDRELLSEACKPFKGNVWYINHFCYICDSLSRGYIMEPVLVEALDTLISIHEPRFQSVMNDLTTFQVSFLRAVIEGVTKFSSADIIRHYNLNSSANVLRLKEALCRKEVITFDENDTPHVIDPLFEYWVTKKFFEINA